jgi:tRNA nucleotidyltransferase (CCA-adding enzyme)
VRRALPLLDRVSGARIRHELMLTLQEKQPERVLCRMDELGLLAAIQPGLTCDEWLRARFARLRHQLDLATWDLTPDDVPFLYGALLAYRLPPFEVRALSQRLRLPSREAQHLLLVLDLDAALGGLAVDAAPSAVTHALEPFPLRVVAAVWAASEEGPIRRHLIEYGRQWRRVETALTGNDLKEMGLKPSPLFGHLLGRLKDARLDGRVSCRAEEVALIRTLLTQEALAQEAPGQDGAGPEQAGEHGPERGPGKEQT